MSNKETYLKAIDSKFHDAPAGGGKTHVEFFAQKIMISIFIVLIKA